MVTPPPNKRCFLLLGGARSGKSRFALSLAKELGDKVLFVATGEALDDEMRARIDEHKKARPQHWRTLELPTGVGRGIKEQVGDAEVVIVDCLTLLVSNLLTGETDYPQVEKRVKAEMDGLIECMDEVAASFIIVSNEIGFGLVPGNKLGRFYRDLLGEANQLVAEHADEVYLMVAGIPVKVKTS